MGPQKRTYPLVHFDSPCVLGLASAIFLWCHALEMLCCHTLCVCVRAYVCVCVLLTKVLKDGRDLVANVTGWSNQKRTLLVYRPGSW